MGSIPIIGTISGSRAATILGLNGFQTLFSLWQIMMEEIYIGFNASKRYILPSPVDNPAVRWGSAFESAICKKAESLIGEKIIWREKTFTKKITDTVIASCHIDGEYQDKKILHEGKTTSLYNFYDWGKPGTDRVTDYIACQVQHQEMVTGLEQCIVSVLVFPKRPDEWEKEGYFIDGASKDSDNELYMIGKKAEKIENFIFINPLSWASILAEMGFFHQYPIAANPEAHKLMIDKYTEFWRKHIVEKIEPQPESYDDIKRCFPQPVGTVIADENIEMLAGEYSAIGKEIGDSGDLAKRQDVIKVDILNYVRKMEPVIDNDSMEKLIIRNKQGEKIGSFGKNKNGTLIYRGKD
jgi:hypothetical protein